MSDTSNSGTPLYAPLIPSLAQAYMADPRRALVESLLSQGQQAVNRPLYNPISAVAAALTDAMGPIAGMKLASDYQDLNKQALSDFQSAEMAGAGTPASVDAATGQATPGTAPNPGATVAKLSQSPVWAPLIAQQQMAAYGKMLEPQKLAPQDQLVVNGHVVATNNLSTQPLPQLLQYRNSLDPNDPNKPLVDSAIIGALQKSGYIPQVDKNGNVTMPAIPGGPASPAQVGALAGATRNAQNQSDLDYKPAIEGGIAKAKAPYTVVTVRPGGAALPATSVLGMNAPPAPGTTRPPVPGTAAPPAQTYAPPTPSALTPNYVGQSLLAQAAARANTDNKPQGNVAPPVAPTPRQQGQAPSLPTTLTPQMPGNSAAPTQGNPAAPTQSNTAALGEPGGVGLEHLAGGGVSIPNPEIVSPLIHNDATEVAKDRENALGAQKDQATLQAIQDLMPRVRTGWGADTQLEAARIMKAAGVSDAKIQEFMSTDVAQGQALNKLFLINSATAVRGMGAREPGSVIKLFQGAYPNLGTDPQAVNLMTNVQYMNALRLNKLADDKTTYLNQSVNDYQRKGEYRGLMGFNSQFAKTDPPESYLHAAEAMSGMPNGWAKIKDPVQQQAIIDLIPSGSVFMAPNGQMKVKP